MGQADGFEDRIQLGSRLSDALQRRRDPQILTHGERQTVAIVVAEIAPIGGVFRRVTRDRLPLPPHLPVLRHGKASQNAKQASLSGTIWPFDRDQGPGSKRKRQPLKQQPITSHAAQIYGRQQGLLFTHHVIYPIPHAQPAASNVAPKAQPTRQGRLRYSLIRLPMASPTLREPSCIAASSALERTLKNLLPASDWANFRYAFMSPSGRSLYR